MPHEVIHWAIQAKPLRTHVLRQRAEAKRDKFVWAITESHILVYFTQLLKQVELGLKARIRRFFRRLHGEDWWSHFPLGVQRAAERRRGWALQELGERRSPRPHDMSWLSFGDTMKVLAALSPKEWQTCLAAETRRRRQFERSFRRVKVFRDLQVAHPKPNQVSTSQIAGLCRSLERLPLILLPREWSRVTEFLNMVSRLPSAERQDLSFRASGFSGRSPIYLDRWLACPNLARPGECSLCIHLGKRRMKWRREILEWCAAYDSGGYTYFGRPYDLSIKPPTPTSSGHLGSRPGAR